MERLELCVGIFLVLPAQRGQSLEVSMYSFFHYCTRNSSETEAFQFFEVGLHFTCPSVNRQA